MYRRILIFILSLCIAVAFHFPVQSEQSDALRLSLKAQQFYSSGQLTQAVTAWQAAARAYQQEGDRLGRTKSLINQAQALQNLGLYPKACRTLLVAFDIEHPDCNGERIDKLIENVTTEAKSRLNQTQGIGLRSLGNVARRKGMLSRAQKLLKLSASATLNSPELPATLLALGNVETALGDRVRDRWDYNKISEIIDRQAPELALDPYEAAFRAYDLAAADKMASSLTQVQAQLNDLSLIIDIEDWWQQQISRRVRSWQRFKQTGLTEAATNFAALLNSRFSHNQTNLIAAIEAKWQQLPPSRQGIYAQINYIKSLNKLGKTNKVAPVLQRALEQAKTIGDKRAESYVLGYLGQYYRQQGQIPEAIALTNRALILAQAQNASHDAREITYLWQSQLGQLWEQQNETKKAIEAYTSAFNTLQSLRTDLNVSNQVVQFDFRQEVKPVYLSLANLLLQTEPNISLSKSLTSIDLASTRTDNVNPNLELARQVIESLQLAELDNYFQDPCSETASTAVTIDQIDPQAAVIYPIVLPDRLEVILSVAGKPLQRFTTPIAETAVNQTLDLLYDSLYNQSVDNSAVNIFSTVPLNPTELTENTKIILPLLQQVHSWLIKPLRAELKSNQIKTLVFVLNGRLQSVPMAALYDGQQYLLENYAVALTPSLQLLDTKSKPREKIKVLAAGLSQQVEIQGSIFPALNYVPEELNQIEAIFPESRQLLNQEFTTNSIQQQLKKGFPIIHLATHGVFSSDPQQTFIVTGDRNTIDINTLSALLSSSSSTKPELIVLSACDTATGDERVILGFAGVAVRSGSSTLASLWSVEDASTAQLMSQFYREFENPLAKKVDALQKAQLSLIQSMRANPIFPELKQLPPHPYYWAPYVLVGNWQ